MARETHRCPECGAIHKMLTNIPRGYPAEVRPKIIELRQRHPDWPPSVIAIKANTSHSYTVKVLRNAGLPIKAVYDNE